MRCALRINLKPESFFMMINRVILAKIGVKELICDEKVLACDHAVPLAGRLRHP